MPKQIWKKIGDTNVILEADWGHISYNPETGKGPFIGRVITDILNEFGQNVKDGEETALYNEESDVWRILTGDFRKEYEKAFPRFEECLKVYNENIKHRNNYSIDRICPECGEECEKGCTQAERQQRARVDADERKDN